MPLLLCSLFPLFRVSSYFSGRRSRLSPVTIFACPLLEYPSTCYFTYLPPLPLPGSTRPHSIPVGCASKRRRSLIILISRHAVALPLPRDRLPVVKGKLNAANGRFASLLVSCITGACILIFTTHQWPSVSRYFGNREFGTSILKT